MPATQSSRLSACSPGREKLPLNVPLNDVAAVARDDVDEDAATLELRPSARRLDRRLGDRRGVQAGHPVPRRHQRAEEHAVAQLLKIAAAAAMDHEVLRIFALAPTHVLRPRPAGVHRPRDQRRIVLDA